jgi:integrase
MVRRRRRGTGTCPLFSDDRNGLRERILWRMLYETAARAEEILSRNVEDHDTEFRRTRVISKGGAIEYLASLGRYVRLGEETSPASPPNRPGRTSPSPLNIRLPARCPFRAYLVCPRGAAGSGSTGHGPRRPARMATRPQ